MNSDIETVKQKPDRALYGKVVGVVKYRHQLKSLCRSLAILGVREVEVLSGTSGIQRLETWKQPISRYLFGDMEGEVIQRSLDAISDGHIVFAAAVVPEFAEKTARIANVQGAFEVMHFGKSAVTNY